MTRYTILMLAARSVLIVAVVVMAGVGIIYYATEPATLMWMNRPLSPFR